MNLQKIVASMVITLVPAAAFAAPTPLAPIEFKHNKQAEKLWRMAENVPPEALSVPSLRELDQEIDKNDTLIQKKSLPDFKLPQSTKKIIDKLPSNLSGTKRSSGKAQLKSSDFNARDDFDKTKQTKSATPAAQPAPSRAGSMFEIKIVNKVQNKEPEALAMASKAYAVGQYESAIAIYKDVLAKDEKSRDALFGIATSYHKNGQKGQAKTYYAKLLDLYPHDHEGQNNFLALVASEVPEDALKELDELARTNPQYAPIYAHKAMIYMEMGNDENAIKNLYQAMRIDPENNDYKYNLAVLFDKNRYYENARRLYSDLVEDSYAGKPIPANRIQLTERINFLSTKIKQ